MRAERNISTQFTMFWKIFVLEIQILYQFYNCFCVHIHHQSGFSFLREKSFLVFNLLNNQSDFLKFLWRHDFFQYKLDSRCFLKMLDETPDWNSLFYLVNILCWFLFRSNCTKTFHEVKHVKILIPVWTLMKKNLNLKRLVIFSR